MIKQLVQGLLRKIGYQLCKYPTAEHGSRLELFFDLWSRVGSKPKLIVDIGANYGNWARMARRYFPDAQIIMIEPQARLRQHSEDLIQTGKVRWVEAGVAGEEGNLDLVMPPRADSASFVVSKEMAEARGWEVRTVPVITLNKLLESEPVAPGIIKIDAEGLDLEVLRGASQWLGKVDVFLVECSVISSIYANSVTKVCSLMEQHGYRVFGITDLNDYPDRGMLWLTEFVFVREDLPVWKELNELGLSAVDK